MIANGVKVDAQGTARYRRRKLEHLERIFDVERGRGELADEDTCVHSSRACSRATQ